MSRRDFGTGAVATAMLGLLAACGVRSTASPSSTDSSPSGVATDGTAGSDTTVVGSSAPSPPRSLAAWKPRISDDGRHQLLANNTRLKVAGVIVMGVPAQNQFTADFSTGTGSFSRQEGQYPNRDLVCATVKAWGGNAIRLKFTSTDIAAQSFGWTTAQYLHCIRDWVGSARAHGLYTALTDWSAAGSPPSGKSLSDWPAWLPATGYPVWAAIADALKRPDGSHDPYVWWEPVNEPADVAWPDWRTAFESISTFFRRDVGYTGLLVCDGLHGSTGWDAATFDALMMHDATLPGMRRGAQVAFANHDYALTSKTSAFDVGNWLSQTLATETGQSVVGGKPNPPALNQYCRFESAFGNYTSGLGGNESWSRQAASAFSDLYRLLPSYAGAFAYVWGPWSDANAIVANDNQTPSVPWGKIVKAFLGSAGATPVPPVS